MFKIFTGTQQKLKQQDPELNAHYNTGLEEAQAGIKIAGRTINHLRYADDTTLITESKEELKCLLVKVKE